ncbi:MAG: prolyl oligopeptidase family serine peptidase [Deltaproteobacteria bacterium]|nr:prolyl oligopeptidase family serine peptidase [Deltaproteobacteria bacterium]
MKVYFDDVTYDYELKRIVGAAIAGGADLNESLAAARTITPGDGDSWYRAWHSLGQSVLAMAEASLKRGHRVSAREGLLRACNYFRAADFFLHGDPQDPRILKSWRISRDCFRRAAKLMDHPVEVVAIPYENTTLPGYFLRPDSSAKPRPTLLLQTGFDGTAEELYFGPGKAALARGYNLLIFEGPGQGGVIREQKLVFRPDWEKVVTPVVDFVLHRPEVDPQRLALMGLSMGGCLAPRAAAFEHRLAGLIANPGVYDMMAGHDISAKQWAEMKKDPAGTNQALRARMNKDLGFRWLVNNGMFTTGAKSPLEFFEKFSQYNLGDLVPRIKATSLVIASDGDHFYSFAEQKKLYNLLTCPKTLLVFTHAEHATPHCQMGALAVSDQHIFDWLDETMAGIR